jgi:hypothetical protein
MNADLIQSRNLPSLMGGLHPVPRFNFPDESPPKLRTSMVSPVPDRIRNKNDHGEVSSCFSYSDPVHSENPSDDYLSCNYRFSIHAFTGTEDLARSDDHDLKTLNYMGAGPIVLPANTAARMLHC